MSWHDPHVILHLRLLYLGIGVGAGVKVKVIYTTTNGLPIVKWTKICLCRWNIAVKIYVATVIEILYIYTHIYIFLHNHKINRWFKTLNSIHKHIFLHIISEIRKKDIYIKYYWNPCWDILVLSWTLN
jgi:hypothetical protein